MTSQPNEPPSRSRGALTLRSVLILALAIGGTVGFLVLFIGYLAPDTGDTELSGAGQMAMWLGIVFSLVVGVGLMGLVFYSSRRGYDDAVASSDDPAPRP